MSWADFVGNAQVLGVMKNRPRADATVFLPNGQPAAITRPVTKAGKVVATFSVAQWVLNGGAPREREDYTGFDASGNPAGVTSITSQPNMMKWSPAGNGVEEVRLTAFATNCLTTTLGGRIGLWVYVENQPGYEPGGKPTGSIGITLTTDPAGKNTHALKVGWNSNQVVEGWNFLTFVMRAPAAYVPGSAASEDHPYGVSPTVFGTGTAANIKDAPITAMKIDVSGMGGATLYFDSLITAWETEAQVVLGVDVTEDKLLKWTLPLFDEYGWTGYTAAPKRVWTSGSRVVVDWTTKNTYLKQVYAAGWDCTNHTANHIANGTLTSPAEIAYEINSVNAYYRNQGLVRGTEFYCSPMSSTSRLAEKVVQGLGIKLQRHSRKANVAVTPFGVPNIQHIGSSDIGSATGSAVVNITGGVATAVAGLQLASRINRVTDVMVAYGDTWFPFWHSITELGDTGSGEDLTGDNLIITRSAFEKAMAYIRELELQGRLRVCAGITGFYYGMDKA